MPGLRRAYGNHHAAQTAAACHSLPPTHVLGHAPAVVPRWVALCPRCHVTRALPPSTDGTEAIHDLGKAAVSRRTLLTGAGTLALNQSRPAGAVEPSDDAASGSGTLDGEHEPRLQRSGRPLPAVRKVLLQPPAPKGRKKKQAAAGVRLSRIWKGCWQLGGAHKGDQATDHTTGAAALKDFEAFVDAGITTVDTSDVWGPSEALIGNYLRLYPWRRGDLQVVTKVTVTPEDIERLSADLIRYRVRSSLARLNIASADMVLLQWEDGLEERSPRGAGLVDAALWLADLQGEGLISTMGVAGLDAPHLMQVLDAGAPVCCNQVQFSVLDRRPAVHMQPLARERGVQMVATGTLAGGFLSRRWVGKPASKARLDTLSKAKYGAQLKQAGGWTWLQEMLEALTTVAKRHKVTPSAVALQWALQQPGVACAAVGARNALHVRDLQAALTITLDEEDILTLDAAYEGCPNPASSDVFVWERGGAWA